MQLPQLPFSISSQNPRNPRSPFRWRAWLASGLLFVAMALIAVGAALKWQPSSRSINIDEETMARRALAVLAFNDRRQNVDGSSFGDDLADAIGVQLQRNGMRVINRSSAGPQNPAAPEFERIGAEQHVRFVLNGRITQVGEIARVATNLTEISTGAVYRLFQADLRPDDESARARYAQQVTTSLQARYFDIEITRARQPGRDKDPVDAVVLAWRDLDRGGPEDLQGARRRFEFASSADPNSLDSLTGLVVAHLTEFYYFYCTAPREKLDMAERVLKRGLDLSQDNPKLLAAWAEMLMLRQKAGRVDLDVEEIAGGQMVETDGRTTFDGKSFTNAEFAALVAQMRRSCAGRGAFGYTNLTQKANLTLDLIDFLDSNFAP